MTGADGENGRNRQALLILVDDLANAVSDCERLVRLRSIESRDSDGIYTVLRFAGPYRAIQFAASDVWDIRELYDEYAPLVFGADYLRTEAKHIKHLPEVCIASAHDNRNLARTKLGEAKRRLDRACGELFRVAIAVATWPGVAASPSGQGRISSGCD